VADVPAFRQAIDQAIERVNARHSHAEGIRHWRILPQDLTMEAGHLTPTLKVRREAVVAANRDLVEEMYA
jgi:long-chain acyl-CoA synthetase